MRPALNPWRLLSVILAGMLNEHQHRVIEYLEAENQVLREHIGNRRLRFTDDQRRRLAVLGKVIGRKALSEICTIVTPDTVLRWHRKLIARKYNGSRSRRIGRPGIMLEIRRLIVRMATENRHWGYERIEGEMREVGYSVARTTVANIVKEHGLEPALWQAMLISNAI